VAVYGPGNIYLGTPVGTWNVDSEKEEELVRKTKQAS
jgi:hypothetical protein